MDYADQKSLDSRIASLMPGGRLVVDIGCDDAEEHLMI